MSEKNCFTCAQQMVKCLSDNSKCGDETDWHNWTPKQPAREPQCKTRADLHDHMARLYRMCEGTTMLPGRCIRQNGKEYSRGDYALIGMPAEFEFALAIVEGKPVFRGDVLYTSDGRTVVTDAVASAYETEIRITFGEICRSFAISSLTWNPPVPKTITINGKEFVAPVYTPQDGFALKVGGVAFWWPTEQVRDAIETAIIDALDGKTR